jgi:hypothetical protein
MNYLQDGQAVAHIELDGISDSIGPVIQFAFMKEKTSDLNPDSLKINFSREVSEIDLEIMHSYFQFNSLITMSPDTILKEDSKRFVFIYPGGTITLGDSVKLKPNKETSLISSFNQKSPSHNNQKVEIILDRGTVEIANQGNEFQDRSSDGRLDHIQLVLGRPIETARLEQMTIEYNWLKFEHNLISDTLHFTLKASSCEITDGIKLLCPLSDTASFEQKMTYFIPNQWGQLWFSQPDFEAANGTSKTEVQMLDAMGPIITAATMKKSNNPETRDEHLTVSFSEAINSSTTTSNSLFDYLIETNIENYVHGEDFKWMQEHQALKFNIEPNMQRPNIGDKIRIHSSNGETSLVQDSNGNSSSPENPWVDIEGKQTLQFFFNSLAELPQKESIDSPVFDSLMFFDKGEKSRDTLTQKNLSGFGFSFTFKDSINTIEARKEIKIKYSISIYDQVGQFVVNKRDFFNCETIEGYMQEHQPNNELSSACNPASIGKGRELKVFIPWNYKSYKGRAVGSGIYLLHVTASSEYKNSTLYSQSSMDTKIGISR